MRRAASAAACQAAGRARAGPSGCLRDSGVLAPQPLVLDDRDISENAALAGQPKPGVWMMREEAKPPELCSSRLGNEALDANRASSADRATSTVNRFSDAGVERETSPQ